MDEKDSAGSSAKNYKLESASSECEDGIMAGEGDNGGEDKSTTAHSHVSDSDVKLLKSENTYLKRQVILQERIVTDQANIIIAAGPNNLLTDQLLPDVVVNEIIKNMPTQNELLKCRLVCKNWNEIIENSTELMRRIKVPIWQIKQFLDLSIVKKAKVKSIVFKNTSPLKTDPLISRKFIEVIRNLDIQKVEFSFDSNNLREATDQQRLLRLVLIFCSNLQELIITNSFEEEPLKFFRHCGLGSTIKIPAAEKISIFSINVNCFIESDATGLINLLLMLPKLKEIKFSGSCDSGAYIVILQGLCKYLQNYRTICTKPALQLEIPSSGYAPFSELSTETDADHKAFIDLLVECGKYKVQLEGLPVMNFNFCSDILASLRITEEIQLEKVGGNFTLKGTELTNLNLLASLNIKDLFVNFNRDAFDGELTWIKNLKCLESLTLINYIEPFGTTLGPSSIKEIEETVSAGIPSLKELFIENDVFDSVNVCLWPKYFPNITYLQVANWKSTSENFIYELTAFEFMSELNLIQLPNLLDASFTADCVNKYSELNGSSDASLLTAPAIACFKSLKVLVISCCEELTDECIINGISKNKTLEKLEVFKCKNITEDCWKSCELEGDFTKDDQ